MPKMKTKKSALKRIKVRGNGSIKRGSANLRHILTKKSTQTKRKLRGITNVHDSDKRAIRMMLPYSG